MIFVSPQRTAEMQVYVGRVFDTALDIQFTLGRLSNESVAARSIEFAFGLKSGVEAVARESFMTMAYLEAPAAMAAKMRSSNLAFLEEVVAYLREFEQKLRERVETRNQVQTDEEAQETGPANLNFSLNITPANYSGLNPGAGWGGFSFTNEGGIAQIDSTGKITWSGWGGTLSNGGQTFGSGQAAIAALTSLLSSLFGTGRTDNGPAAPPATPPEIGPEEGAPSGIE